MPPHSLLSPHTHQLCCRHAASLWDSQVEYKEHLHNHYKQNAKNDKP